MSVGAEPVPRVRELMNCTRLWTTASCFKAVVVQARRGQGPCWACLPVDGGVPFVGMRLLAAGTRGGGPAARAGPLRLLGRDRVAPWKASPGRLANALSSPGGCFISSDGLGAEGPP